MNLELMFFSGCPHTFIQDLPPSVIMIALSLYKGKGIRMCAFTKLTKYLKFDDKMILSTSNNCKIMWRALASRWENFAMTGVFCYVNVILKGSRAGMKRSWFCNHCKGVSFGKWSDYNDDVDDDDDDDIL